MKTRRVFMNQEFEFVELNQDTPEWLEWRRDKVTASMAPVLLGVDPWTTVSQLFDQIILGEEKPVTPQMRRGKYLESEVREQVNKDLGKSYKPAVIERIDNPNHAASLDGFYIDDNCGFNILEIKCPNIKTHKLAQDGIVPINYIPQLQWQMYVAGVNHMMYSSFNKTRCDLLVKRDQGMIDELVRLADQFRERIVNFNLPKLEVDL